MALCHYCTMLFLDAEEVAVGIALGEDNSFATNSTAFRAAYVEGVAMVSKEGEGDVVAWSCEAIAKAGTVDVELYLVFLAYSVDVCKFMGGIQCAKLGGLGDVNQSGINAMAISAVAEKLGEIVP